MLCGVRVEWPPEFVDEQVRIAKDPKRAQKELLYLNGKLHMIASELKSLRSQTDKSERRQLTLERERDEERTRSRRSENALRMTEDKLKELEKLRAVTDKQLGVLEAERDREKVRADHLQRQLRIMKLKGKSRGIHTAIQKLTQSPAVAKRIAAACHPDKCPKELSEVASELFRFVQSMRERERS